MTLLAAILIGEAFLLGMLLSLAAFAFLLERFHKVLD